MKFFLFFVALIKYIAILFLVYFLTIRLFPINVVFYSSLYAAFAALFPFALLLKILPLFRAFDFFERFNIVVVAGLVGYIFAISVPTVIDRSLSFYILEKLQQRGGAIQLSKFEDIFSNEYIREHKLVDIRLTEQSESGTIYVDGDCVRLTARGAALADFSGFFRRHFLPRKRLLRGQYTDELISPFSRSDSAPDYLCD